MIKDAQAQRRRRSRVWQKDDKVWLELKPEDFNKPFFLSPKLKTGIGERGFYGGLMQDSGIIEFRRVHNQVQLIWRNVGYIAKPGTPEARAIEAGYSPSLLASAPVLSLPEPERKSVLVEANTLFLADLLGFGMDLQRTYRQGYAFDPRNSAITQVRGDARRARARGARPLRDGVDRGAAAGHAARHAAAVGAALAARPAQPVPDHRTTRSRALPGRADARPPRRPARRLLRRAAASTSATTCSARRASASSTAGGSRRRIPTAALSEPVKPIVYWIDRTVPFKYRAGDHRRRPRVEQGVREDRLQERDRGSRSSPTTPTSTRSTSAAPRSAG